MKRTDANPWGLRSANPSAWPQYPYEDVPATPESSPLRYEVRSELDLSLTLRDGVELLFDLYHPVAPGQQFPALLAISPYTRQLQRSMTPWGPNEAGITEFWVPRGYVHVVLDVRGTNGSGGDWQMQGPVEQEDYAEVIEWIAAQPWCTGRVGMVGCSFFGMAQNVAAAQAPPSLKAVFPYDAKTDMYRYAFFPGGIPSEWANFWFMQIAMLNNTSGHNPNMAAVRQRFAEVLELRYPLDGPYYRERSAWPVLSEVTIPSYYGSDWQFHETHLTGTFDAYQRSGASVKRMLVGPRPTPFRPFAAYHQEALRWYDAHLKDLDTGVLEGDPIRLWVQGAEEWRGEREWPLARTDYQDWYLSSDGSIADTPEGEGELELDYNPAEERWLFGEPRLSFRTAPFDAPFELTGPIQLDLSISSTATDTDWICSIQDEAPDGSARELAKSRLRSSHRRVDQALSRANAPWHPHEDTEPLVPGELTELQLGFVATSNVFLPGHRLRLDVANCDSSIALIERSKVLRIPARNTVHLGRERSRLSLPVIAQ